MARKISKQKTGGCVDKSIDPKALATLGVDGETAERIAELLGKYRLKRDYRDTAPTPAESILHIEQTQSLISELLAKMELMPEDFKALATDDYMRVTGEFYEQAEERLTMDLLRYKSICSNSIIKMQEWPSTAGRTQKYLEDKLLAGVAELLEPYSSGKESAAGNAADFLRHAGINTMPVDQKKARAAVLRHIKRK